jgi:SpoVK/Ycf46/Vps4 family AAA+-type ATPase
MVLAYKKGDTSAFQAAVQGHIDEERRKNHPVVARDLERILGAANVFPLTPLSSAEPNLADVPRDKERGTPLVEIRDDPRPLEDLVLPDATRKILDRMINERRHDELLRSHGLHPIGKVLFCGPPGCGKTVVAGAIARALYVPLVLVRFDAVVSSYLGDTAANLRKAFDFARARPMVLFFDEFDAIGKRRGDVEDHGELKRVVNSFLQMLDGFRGESLIMAATNHEQLLDPALWRRFDEIVHFPRPTADQIELLLVRTLRQIGLSPAVALKEQARRLVGMSFADVEHIAFDAIKQVVIDGGSEIDRSILDASVERQRHRLALTGTDLKASTRQEPGTKRRSHATPER